MRKSKKPKTVRTYRRNPEKSTVEQIFYLINENSFEINTDNYNQLIIYTNLYEDDEDEDGKFSKLLDTLSELGVSFEVDDSGQFIGYTDIYIHKKPKKKKH